MPAGETSHEDLLQAIAQRDRAAFAELFRRFAPKLVGMLMYRGAPRVQADEVVQDVLLTVWRQAGRFDPQRASAEAWLYTITRNRWIDRVRRERRPAADPLDPALVVAPTPLDHVAGQQRARRIAAALDALPEAQATVLRKTYFEHKTLAVVANELDIPLGTAKSRVRLAMQRLRSALRGEGEQP